jgi:biotin carboxyl carrier protein
MKLAVEGVEIEARRVPGGVEVRYDGRTVVVATARRADGAVVVGGRVAHVDPGGVYLGGERFRVAAVPVPAGGAGPAPAGGAGPAPARGAPSGIVAAPTPGTVARLLVSVGDEVAAGQPLLVLVAMKTELTLAAPRAGRIVRLSATAGENVRAGAALVEVAP